MGLIARYGPRWPGAQAALVSLRGVASRPGVHEIELGVTLDVAIDRLGGVNRPASAHLVGGYFGSWISSRDAARVELNPGTIGAGALIAFPEDVCALEDCARVIAYLAGESARQCGPCANGLPALAGAFSAAIAGGRDADAQLAHVRRFAALVAGRGACRHPDGAARFALSALDAFADELELHLRRGSCGCRRLRVLPLPDGRRRR